MTFNSLIQSIPQKPYYLDEQAGIVIYCADNHDILPHIPDKSLDLVLTDPPYNAGVDYGEMTKDKQSWDIYCQWLSLVILELERLADGLVLMFLSVNGMLELSARKRPRHVCIWVKPMAFTPRLGGTAFLPHYEPCLVYGKTWGESGRVPNYSLSDVWRFNTAERNGHPCPKPDDLIRFIISNTPSNVILDPFLGSGTTAVAAKILGRKCVGIEIEEKYCAIAAKRLSQSVMPLEIPQPEVKQESLL